MNIAVQPPALHKYARTIPVVNFRRLQASVRRGRRSILPIVGALVAGLACQLGGRATTPAPPVTATTIPLPTIGLPLTPTPSQTPVGVATATSTATSEAATGSIGGWVWHDLCDPGPDGGPSPAAPPPGCVADGFGGYRADGTRETAEPVLGGVVVRLGVGACPSTGLAESSTATSGPSYSFSGLAAGTYCVSIDPFGEPNLSTLLPGQWTYPGRAAGLVGQTVSLAPGQTQADISFGWDYQFLPISGGTSAAGCTYAASLVEEVTVPAETVLAPGTVFVKTWRVRNEGTCTWGRAEDVVRTMVRVGGTALAAPDSVPLPAEVPPGSTVDLSITFTAPAAPGTYRSEWKLLAEPGTPIGVGPGGDVPLTAQIAVAAAGGVLRPNAVFHAQRLTAPLVTDGTFLDWTGLPYSLATAAYRPENWSGASDQSARFALAWDNDYLYLAIQVLDDVFVQTQAGESLFRGDSLELLLDVDLNGDFDSGTLSSDDYQLGLSPGGNRSSPEAYLWFPRPKAGRPASVILAARADVTGQGYALEAAIPWALLNLVPAGGDHYGFALSASDNDTPGTAEQQSMVSTETGRRLADPTTWGSLILAP